MHKNIYISGPPMEVITPEWRVAKEMAAEKPGDEFLRGYHTMLARALYHARNTPEARRRLRSLPINPGSPEFEEGQRAALAWIKENVPEK